MLLLLPLFLGLACSLQAPRATETAQSTPEPTKPATRAFLGLKPSPTPQADLCTVTAAHLNLRACAGTDCAVIEVLEAGEILTITTRGEWHNVTTSTGRPGWINSNYCKNGE